MHGYIPPLPQYILMAWCLIKQEKSLHGVVLKHRDNFTFTLGITILNKYLKTTVIKTYLLLN
jgi:hypothetical protein